MEDFFDQIKNNLKNRPEPPFEEQIWRSLKNKLDEQEQGGNRSVAGFAGWRVAMPLLCLLLCSNTLFFFELKKANDKISALEVRRDTIFQTKVVYQTDTIYLTQVVRKNIQMPGQGISQNISNRAIATHQPVFSQNLTDPFFEKTEPKTDLPQPIFQKKNPIESVQNQAFHPPASALEFPELALLKWKSGAPVLNTKPTATEKKKTLRHHLYAMRPKEFQAAVTGGLAYPLSDGIDRQTGFSAGVEAMVHFSPNLAMWADASFFNVEFESNRMDESIGIPVVNPAGEFTFVKAEVPQPSLQYSAGMQYFFNAGKKWKPFAGLGYGAVTMLPYDVLYEFRDEAAGVEWMFEESVGKRELMGGFLLFRAGLEYEISKNWRWQLRATYRTNWEETGFQVAKMMGIQSGLGFQF